VETKLPEFLRPYFWDVKFEELNVDEHWYLILKNKAIPALIGVEGITAHSESGDDLIIDSDSGEVIISPGQDEIKRAKEKQARYNREREFFGRGRQEEARISGRHRLILAANADTREDIEIAVDAGAEGVGLVRTEDRYDREVPSIEELTAAFLAMARVTALPVAIRLPDKDDTQKLMEAGPSSKFLGIRYLLNEGQGILEDFLRAFFTASAKSENKNLRLLVPMIAEENEVRGFWTIFEAVRRGMIEDERITSADLDLLKVGAMVETREAIKIIDYLVKQFDFLSIGSNDLIASLFGLDRAVQESNFYYQHLDPLFLEKVEEIIRAVSGHNRRNKEKVGLSVCGDWAAQKPFVLFISGRVSGSDTELTLSMPAGYIPRMKEFVRNIAEADLKSLQEVKREAFDRAALAKVEEIDSRLAKKLAEISRGGPVSSSPAEGSFEQGVRRAKGESASSPISSVLLRYSMIYSRLDGAGEMIKNNELWLAVEILRDLLSQKEAEADFFLREEIFYRLGRAFRLLEMEGDGGKEYFNSSRACLESALMLSVDTPERESGIYIELGHLYLQRGGYERARTYFQEAARRAVLTSPESRVMALNAFWGILMIDISRGDLEGALDALSRLMALMTPQDILATEIYAKVETLFKQGALALETDQEKYRALGRMSGFYFTRAEALLKVYLPLKLF